VDAYQGSAVEQALVVQIGHVSPLDGRIDMSVDCEFGAGALDGSPDGAVITDC